MPDAPLWGAGRQSALVLRGEEPGVTLIAVLRSRCLRNSLAVLGIACRLAASTSTSFSEPACLELSPGHVDLQPEHGEDDPKDRTCPVKMPQSLRHRW